MIKYRKFCDDEYTNISNAGCPTFHPVVMADPDGSEFDIKYSDEVVDIQETIDSFKDSTDINLLVQRFTNGDLNAIGNFGILDPEDKSVVDLTVLPEDVHTLHDLTEASEKFYNGLPDEVKSIYSSADDFYNNYDPNKVMAALSDNSIEEVDEKGVISE